MKKTLFRKIGICLALAICSAFPLSSTAQTANITLDMQNVPLEQVMSEIKNQTRYLFVNKNVEDLSVQVSINVSDCTIEEALNKLFAGKNIGYEIKQSNIIIFNADKTEVEQKPITVSGCVRDNEGNAIIGATVSVVGTTIGTSTDLDGNYSLQVPPPHNSNTVLRYSYLGYNTEDIPVQARTRIDVSLREEAVDVDAVVVTALGIKRSEKALSYNVQQVSSDAVTANKDANFINALNGKVAGVTINASSSGAGGASKVVMRGSKSISQSSNALYVIDGVPMFTTVRDGRSKNKSEFDSQGSTDPIADINPEDIESISVLTGAAAAALYGSDAANGAIVVTTKRGQEGRLSVNVVSSVEVSTPFVLPRFQNRYGTGDLNSDIGSEIRSWGKRLNSANQYGYDPRKDYLKPGVTNTESVSLSTGTEKNQTYFSAAAINSRGIVPNNRYDRYNFTFRNTTSFLKDKMHLDVGASYILQQDRNMVNQGEYGNPIVGAYIFPRGNDWNDIKMYERYDPTRKLYAQYWPMGDAGMTVQNPYWVNYRNLRENRKDRYMLSAALSYDILDWLNVSGRIRLDNTHTQYTEKNYATTNTQLTEYSERGLYGISKMTDRQIYGDVLVNINKTFGEDWSLQANIGASFSDMKYDSFRNRGPIADGKISDEAPGLTNVFNVQNLSNTRATQRIQEGWREQTQSIFGSAEVGFKGTYYLTLTARNDWPSQLAGPHSKTSSFFYPSIGASIVLSQIIGNMPENLSYIKLRGSYASVGVAFERFIANPLYEWESSGLSWQLQTQYPMFDLKPERTKSFEIGLTMRFLKHFNLDVTYYNAHTSNQTFSPQISIGSGYSDWKVQSGNVLNHGVELMLGFNNTWNKFTWDSNYTLSINRNKIVSLAEHIYNPETDEYISIDHLDMPALGNAHFILKEGGTLGDLYSLVDLKYDENGRYFVDENGAVATETIGNVNDYVKLGSILPKANMSWRNDFRWKNLTFGFMVSARIGGVVYSRTQAKLDYFGVSEASAAARDAGGVVINGGETIDANSWYTAIAGGTSIPQFYTYSATNVRLQEVSIGYTFPRKMLRDVCEIQLSLVGRNLWMIYNKAPFDPEQTAMTTDNYYQGIDNFMMPALRNVGFNLRLKF